MKSTRFCGRKQKRAIRRRNRIAYDLTSDKYRQRVIRKKSKPKPEVEEWRDD